MADEASDEYQEFVRGLVPLDEAQDPDDNEGQSPFEALAGRIEGISGGEFRFSFVSGAGMLFCAAALAALLPSQRIADDGFWRLGRDLVAQLLGAGNGIVVPLALGAVVLLLVGALAAAWDGEPARVVLTAQPFIGGAGVIGVSGMWAAFLGLAIANFIVLLLIIVVYIVVSIVIGGIVIGALIGMVTTR